MEAIMEISYIQLMEERHSVRTFDGRPVPMEIRDRLIQAAEQTESPFGAKARAGLIEQAPGAGTPHLGTYGVIKGAALYLGIISQRHHFELEHIGYVGQELLLLAQSMGLSGCWLGGTFNKTVFAKAMGLGEKEIMPAVIPLGWPADKVRMTEKVMRTTTKADSRLPWDQLFFRDSFKVPLTEKAAGHYAAALECIRLAPSAVNKQPWRIIFHDHGFHFYQAHTINTPGREMDIQRIDMGIAMCQFHLAMKELGAVGRFAERPQDGVSADTEWDYLISYVK